MSWNIDDARNAHDNMMIESIHGDDHFISDEDRYEAEIRAAEWAMEEEWAESFEGEI